MLPHQKTLKITYDIEEAQATVRNMKKHYKHYASIYDIKKFVYKTKEFRYHENFYIIIKDYLKPLTEQETIWANYLAEFFVENKIGNKRDVEKDYKKFIDYFNIGDEEVDSAYKSEKFYNFFEQYREMIIELKDFNDLHSANLGWKSNGILAAFDAEYNRGGSLESIKKMNV